MSIIPYTRLTSFTKQENAFCWACKMHRCRHLGQRTARSFLATAGTMRTGFHPSIAYDRQETQQCIFRRLQNAFMCWDTAHWEKACAGTRRALGHGVRRDTACVGGHGVCWDTTCAAGHPKPYNPTPSTPIQSRPLHRGVCWDTACAGTRRVLGHGVRWDTACVGGHGVCWVEDTTCAAGHPKPYNPTPYI